MPGASKSRRCDLLVLATGHEPSLPQPKKKEEGSSGLHTGGIRWVTVLCLACVVGVRAQESEHAGHSGGPVPREILDRPVTLRTGIGTLHEKVSTNSPEAQEFYDQ